MRMLTAYRPIHVLEIAEVTIRLRRGWYPRPGMNDGDVSPLSSRAKKSCLLGYRIPVASSSRAATRFSSDGCVEKSSIRVFPERAGLLQKAFAPSTSCFFSAGT